MKPSYIMKNQNAFGVSILAKTVILTYKQHCWIDSTQVFCKVSGQYPGRIPQKGSIHQRILSVRGTKQENSHVLILFLTVSDKGLFQ